MRANELAMRNSSMAKMKDTAFLTAQGSPCLPMGRLSNPQPLWNAVHSQTQFWGGIFPTRAPEGSEGMGFQADKAHAAGTGGGGGEAAGGVSPLRLGGMQRAARRRGCVSVG